MARPLRFQYAGASYHVMARGDGGKVVFVDDKDRFDLLERLGKVCGSHGWRIHAWVLMGNHFHLRVETPEPNLVTGMKTLLGGFSQAWNRRRKRMGHVFQGRYKSVPVGKCDSARTPFSWQKLRPTRLRRHPELRGPRPRSRHPRQVDVPRHCRVGDHQVGQWSEKVSVTFSGWKISRMFPPVVRSGQSG